MRTIVSLTTIPSRVKALSSVLKRIKEQTYPVDQVYLCLPTWSRRENCPYPSLSEKNVHNLKVIRCKDYGPLTKIYPVLKYERDPDTIIITVDDDVEYPRNLVETLVFYSGKYPDSAVGGSGYTLGSWYNFFGKSCFDEITPVDVLEGFNGCAYRRRFFDYDLADFGDAPKECFYHDDLWISGYLSLKSVQRLVCPGITVKANRLSNPLSGDKIKCVCRFLIAARYLRSKGAFRELKGSLLSWGTFALLLVILVITLLSI